MRSLRPSAFAGHVVALAAFFIVLFSTPQPAHAQSSVSGTVRDTAGGVMPGISIHVTTAAGDSVARTVTDSNGRYQVSGLAPGAYRLTFSLQGFRTVTQTREVAANTAETLSVTMNLQGETTVVSIVEPPALVFPNLAERLIYFEDASLLTLLTRGTLGDTLAAISPLQVGTRVPAGAHVPAFFSTHGGNSYEGRVSLDNTPEGALVSGGHGSPILYDLANAFVGLFVQTSGNMGESETGGPMALVSPRSGGNRYSIWSTWATAGDWSRGNNVDAAQQALGFTSSSGVIGSLDASIAGGGPIKRDRAWFFGGARVLSHTDAVQQVFANADAGNATRWDYVADSSVEARAAARDELYHGKLDVMLGTINKVQFFHVSQRTCAGSTLSVSNEGCRRAHLDWVALGSPHRSPEADPGFSDVPVRLSHVKWTAPVTRYWLLEGGLTHQSFSSATATTQLPPDGIFHLIPVKEESAREGHAANFWYRGVPRSSDDSNRLFNWNASASHVNSNHVLNVGYQGSHLARDTTRHVNNTLTSYTFSHGSPTRVVLQVPEWQTADRTRTAGLYVKDEWTLGRATIHGGLRYDRAWSWSPAEHNGTTTTSPFNPAPIAFARATGVNSFNDFSPRAGIAVDVFGDGYTVLKFSWGRYLSPATTDGIYARNNPAQPLDRATEQGQMVIAAERAWHDGNGNFVVDCDLLNPVLQDTLSTGGDRCGALTGDALNFGSLGSTSTQINPAALHGWGVRPDEWQINLIAERELLGYFWLSGGYTRRSWGNFLVTDNRALAPSDFDAWTISAPADARLPGGGSYPIVEYSPTAGASLRSPDNYVTFETDFGDARTSYWHGVDVWTTARTRHLSLLAGTSTGRRVENRCSTLPLIDSPDARNCRRVDPVETSVRAMIVTGVPHWDVDVSAVVRSDPALELASDVVSDAAGGAAWNVPNTVVQSILGRLPADGLSNGNTVVQLLDQSHRVYADGRRTRVDVRISKTVPAKHLDTDFAVDIYNLFNGNEPTAYETRYEYGVPDGATWFTPLATEAPRTFRLTVSVRF